jgi:hypothetical protein
MNISVLYGLMAGLLSMAFVSVLYLNNPDNLLLGYEKFSWLLILLAMFFGVWRERGLKQDQFIALAEALRTAFRIFVIAYIIKFVVIYTLFNFIDTSLLDKARETAIKIFVEHKNPDLPEEIFEQQLTAYSKGYFGPRIIDIGVMLELILGFVLSLIVAALLRREKPEY